MKARMAAGMVQRFKFGDRVKQVFASKNSASRVGIFVRYVRYNRGACMEITDGNGRFWLSPVRSIVAESMPEQEAEQLRDKLWLEDHRNVAAPELVAEVQARLAK